MATEKQAGGKERSSHQDGEQTQQGGKWQEENPKGGRNRIAKLINKTISREEVLMKEQQASQARASKMQGGKGGKRELSRTGTANNPEHKTGTGNYQDN